MERDLNNECRNENVNLKHRALKRQRVVPLCVRKHGFVESSKFENAGIAFPSVSLDQIHRNQINPVIRDACDIGALALLQQIIFAFHKAYNPRVKVPRFTIQSVFILLIIISKLHYRDTKIDPLNF